MYLLRQLEATIHRLNRQFPVLLVTGPRQVGKTTLLNHLAEKSRHYVSLDVWEHRQLAQSDPNLFFQQFPPPVFVDEIQYAPNLFSNIKVMVDQEKKSGMFWLSGSQQFLLMKNMVETLAGRVAILKLLGLSQSEIHQVKIFPKKPWTPDHQPAHTQHLNIEELSAVVAKGGFPKLYEQTDLDLEVYFSSYIQTYLERDIRDLSKIGDLRDFERFLRACAARSAQMLNLSDLARDVGVSVNTAKQWLSILQASFQVYLLEPHYRNLTQRMIKAPKLYFLDVGLMAYLTGWKSHETIFSGAMAGAFFETFVLSEVLKSWWNHGKEAPIWYWRSKEKEEIDLIFDINGKLFPSEIKLTASPTTTHAATLQKFMKNSSLSKGALICLSPKRLPLSGAIDIVPYSHIC